nr:hypothetical protein [Treponema sp.]
RFGSVAGLILSKAKEDPAFNQEMMRAVENVIRYKIKAGILELKEITPKSSSSEKESEIPSFKVGLNENQKDFDLYRFNEDYKAGMDIYN